MIDLKCLQEITTLPGISGFEHDVVNYLKPIFRHEMSARWNWLIDGN